MKASTNIRELITRPDSIKSAEESNVAQIKGTSWMHKLHHT